ncbi:MAG: hypothetical protein L0Y67_06455 [Gammaproteobacteria bacterium]|nr:hypothetical protein [Gammaproteobacteria bacterium]
MKPTITYAERASMASTRVKKANRLRQAAILLTLLSQVAFVDLSFAIGLAFTDGFEDGTTNKWSFPGTYYPATVVSTARDGGSPHTGTRMMEANWDGTVAWDDPRVYTYAQLPSWDYTNEFLLRFWIRYDADVDPKDGGKLMRLGPGIGINELYMGAQMQLSGGPLFIYTDVEGPGQVTYSGGNVGDNQWHKIEVYIKHDTGTNNGIVRVWTDGVLRIDATNVNSVPTGGRWEPFNVMSNWSNNPGWEHDANNHVYWDDFEIYSDTGTGANGSLADATASVGQGTQTLAAPRGLEVVP